MKNALSSVFAQGRRLVSRRVELLMPENMLALLMAGEFAYFALQRWSYDCAVADVPLADEDQSAGAGRLR